MPSKSTLRAAGDPTQSLSEVPGWMFQWWGQTERRPRGQKSTSIAWRTWVYWKGMERLLHERDLQMLLKHGIMHWTHLSLFHVTLLFYLNFVCYKFGDGPRFKRRFKRPSRCLVMGREEIRRRWGPLTAVVGCDATLRWWKWWWFPESASCNINQQSINLCWRFYSIERHRWKYKCEAQHFKETYQIISQPCVYHQAHRNPFPAKPVMVPLVLGGTLFKLSGWRQMFLQNNKS